MLSEVEKNAIENMVNKGLAISTIKKKLKRTTKEIDQYIESVSPQATINPLVKSGTLARLAKAGLHGGEAVDLMNRTLKKIEDTSSLSTEELYNACIANIGARELIKTTSDTGNAGVAVMTGEASAIDNNTERQSNLSRKAEGVIFRPKDGEMA